ncbi:type II toxin-antitoxin system RelE/ParE family toxin [Turicimonas muris]|uniref:type II toxin-antitoxin system RelE/ParE family toxin n=1 Tax=Turicimonas muris TaxID=1796652 RepID=UPI0032B158FC
MKEFVASSRLKKDIKLAKKRHKDLTLFKEIVRLLMSEQPLPASVKDHLLIGNWAGCRELHLDPDFLFIYENRPEQIYGIRLGSHSDLF